MEGWIKMHRSMLEWEWYDDINTKVLFIHLLFKANFEDKRWHGIPIKRGQLITSRATLSSETGLSERSIRTAIDHLKSTNEITTQATSTYTLITISKYYSYQYIENSNDQVTDQPNDQVATNYRPSTDQVPTTTKELKKERIKEDSKEKLKKESADIVYESEEWCGVMEDWLSYKQSRRESYKSKQSVALCYKKLYNLAGGSPATARLIVEQSIANNWAGLFALKHIVRNDAQQVMSRTEAERIVQAGQAMLKYFKGEA